MSAAEPTARCPECGERIITADGERVCADCGLVTDSRLIDPGPEWRRGLENSDRRRRTGAPLTRSRHDQGLSSEIGYVSGEEVASGNPRRIARLRREHNRAYIASKAERNRVYGFTEIRRICATMGLPTTIRDHSCVLFARAQDAGLFQGRSIEGFAAAAVYAACRVEGIPRTRGEMIDAIRADRAEFEAAFDALNRDLGLPIGPTDPREYLPRFASRLGLEADVERIARRHASDLIEDGLAVGRKPGGVAGACLYAAANENEHVVSQREVADVADVSPVTLRGVCTLLEDLD